MGALGGRDGAGVPGSRARGPAQQVIIYTPSVAGLELKSLKLSLKLVYALLKRKSLKYNTSRVG
jgi:hypothetical protein